MRGALILAGVLAAVPLARADRFVNGPYLQNATPAISNAARYAKIVQDTAVLRRLISVAGEITELAYMEPDDVTKALDEAETKVFEVAEDRVVDSTRALGDLLPLAMDKLQEPAREVAAETPIRCPTHKLPCAGGDGGTGGGVPRGDAKAEAAYIEQMNGKLLKLRRVP